MRRFFHDRWPLPGYCLLSGQTKSIKFLMSRLPILGRVSYAHRSAGLRPGLLRDYPDHAGSETGAPAAVANTFPA